MRVCDLQLHQIKLGMKIRSLDHPRKIGIVAWIDYSDNYFAYLFFPHIPDRFSGFYRTDCECKIYDLKEDLESATRERRLRKFGKPIQNLELFNKRLEKINQLRELESNEIY